MKRKLTPWLGIDALATIWVVSIPCTSILRRSKKNRVISVGLDMFLQILRAFEGLATEVASVWLERNVDADVGGDVITLYHGNVAVGPPAFEVEVVGALATNMNFANMILHKGIKVSDGDINKSDVLT